MNFNLKKFKGILWVASYKPQRKKRIFLGGGLETLEKIKQPVDKFKLKTHATVIVVSHFTYLAKV